MKSTKLIALMLASALVCAQLASCSEADKDGVDTTSNSEDTTEADVTGATDGSGDDTAEDENLPGYSKGLDANGFLKGIKATDYVSLPPYKGIDIDKSLVEVDEADVQAEIDQILARYETYVEITDADATIKDGDTVNIDYVGYVDEVQFDGGNTGKLGTDVTIGVTKYIDDFLEQLIGHHPGESFDIYVTFPEDYGNEELNGKDARFAITINHIHGDIIEAELSDEIARDYGFNSVDELIEDIREFLLGNERFYFYLEVIEGAECSEVPQAVIDYIKNIDMLSIEETAMSYGYTAEDYILLMGGYETIEDYYAEVQEQYEEEAKNYLAAQAIAEIEGIIVTSEEVAEDYSAYIETYGEPYLKQFILFQHRIPAFIAENGNVVENVNADVTE